MNNPAARRFVSLVMATMALAGCVGSAGGSPGPSLLDVPAVTAALGSAGISIVSVTDNLSPRDGAWRCLPGSFRLARVLQQPPAAVAQPGDRPAVDILGFSSVAERATAEAAITPDGQVRAQGCGVIVDWVAAPHVVGARNVLLFIATDDASALSPEASCRRSPRGITDPTRGADGPKSHTMSASCVSRRSGVRGRTQGIGDAGM